MTRKQLGDLAFGLRCLAYCLIAALIIMHPETSAYDPGTEVTPTTSAISK